MSAYLDPASFILADDLLREVMGALAAGHAVLARESRGAAGTLVVKEAEVAVEFDFSVQTRQTRQGVGLAVRPPAGGGFFLLPGLEAAQARTQADVLNRARVTVKIVNVLPSEEERREKPPRDEADPPPLSDDRVPKAMARVLHYLATVQPKAADVLAARVQEVEKLLMEGEHEKARRAVAAFVEDARYVLEDARVPAEVAGRLDALEAWSEAATPAADAIRSYTRDRMAALAPMLHEAGVPAAARQAFAERAAAALGSARTTAARAVLASALERLAPALSGRVLPVAFFEKLEKLDLLDAFTSSMPSPRQTRRGAGVSRRPSSGSANSSPGSTCRAAR